MTNIYLANSRRQGAYCGLCEDFKHKARKESLGGVREELQAVCQGVQDWFASQMTRYGKLTQSKSGQAPKEMMEHQTWIQDQLGFLRSNIRYKGLSESSTFKSQAGGASASATTAHDISRASIDTDSMEISMWSTDSTLQPQKARVPTQLQGALQSTSRSWTSSHR